MQAEIDVINESWNVGGTSNGLADSVGLMVYEGTQVNINQNIVGGFKFYIKKDWFILPQSWIIRRIAQDVTLR